MKIFNTIPLFEDLRIKVDVQAVECLWLVVKLELVMKIMSTFVRKIIQGHT